MSFWDYIKESDDIPPFVMLWVGALVWLTCWLLIPDEIIRINPSCGNIENIAEEVKAFCVFPSFFFSFFVVMFGWPLIVWR